MSEALSPSIWKKKHVYAFSDTISLFLAKIEKETHLWGNAEAYARPSATPQLPPRTNQLGISKCALRASRSLSIVLYERKNTR